MTEIEIDTGIQGAIGAADGRGDADLIGQTLNGRYVVEELLGAGGIGLVYKARHPTLDKHFAIKILRPEVSRDGDIILRFKQEAQAASGIGHEHIVELVDFGVLPNGSAYQAMELLHGVPLSDAFQFELRVNRQVATVGQTFRLFKPWPTRRTISK